MKTTNWSASLLARLASATHRSSAILFPPSLTSNNLWSIDRLVGRTFSFDLLPRLAKNRRAIICSKAIDPADIPEAFEWVLRRILPEDQHKGLKTTEFGHFVRGWDKGRDQGLLYLYEPWFPLLSHECNDPMIVGVHSLLKNLAPQNLSFVATGHMATVYH